MEIAFIDTNIIIEYLKGNQKIIDKLNSFDEIFSLVTQLHCVMHTFI